MCYRGRKIILFFVLKQNPLLNPIESAHQPCVNWQKDCNEFLTPSLTDPQPLWPPPGDMWIVQGHFDFPLPPDWMVELNLAQKVENQGFFFFFFFFSFFVFFFVFGCK